MMTKALGGKICLVTGATRGIGKGIALQLGEAGATVYITGRTLKRTENVIGSLEDTAKEVEARGGVCIPVQCDHSKDDQVEEVFEKIKRDCDGQLDILVNNAYAAVSTIKDSIGKPFWDLAPNIWDSVNNVGLRNHYLCTVYAARMMTKRKQGLVVNISSVGGLYFLFNVAYGVGKEAVDRMAVDCAHELRKHNVAMVSLWPGVVKTELISEFIKNEERLGKQETAKMFENGESPEFSGKVIVALAQDRNLMKKSGHVLLAADLAREYNITDIDGRQVQSFRQLSYLLNYAGWKKTALLIPGFIHVPLFMLHLLNSKF